ncbi:hypothetical protein [Mucilaginibacter phyllosphaerae]|uniref:Uncharacterized protein n=1 Tax=Mucilaginibacter phyllosphaerae TaxID=1812349 RepID=A0A4Y8A9U6_9SPHI|nr:hypothetical protein [Mucilaginibacter phyllosphaerae]MBB3969821.1 hypothetical protein [Mucilaginibacter phyllosphaerae]TEW65196.1 hypothetical protein E2R65_14890 [Mucilaginibacter phyllosphaerae]GGH17338.1 hypothetical protein GCM10007352_27400 [Mucilaginibacter phyllosphaerae]
MAQATIKLTYKQVIDAASTTDFGKNVRLASYQEFLLKSQAYNPGGKLNTFSEMKNYDGRANSLHYKLSFAIGYYIEMLKNRIPVITDTLGNNISFEVPKFELIESDVNNIATHTVAINYITGSLTLLNTIGDYMILTTGDGEETFTVKLQDGLAISSYQEQPKLELAGQSVLAY